MGLAGVRRWIDKVRVLNFVLRIEIRSIIPFRGVLRGGDEREC